MGNILLLIMGLHCFEKKSLKCLAFSLELRINKLFTRTGGTLGALHLFHHSIENLPIRIQWEILESFTLFPKFAKYDNLADSTAC